MTVSALSHLCPGYDGVRSLTCVRGMTMSALSPPCRRCPLSHLCVRGMAVSALSPLCPRYYGVLQHRLLVLAGAILHHLTLQLLQPLLGEPGVVVTRPAVPPVTPGRGRSGEGSVVPSAPGGNKSSIRVSEVWSVDQTDTKFPPDLGGCRNDNGRPSCIEVWGGASLG